MDKEKVFGPWLAARRKASGLTNAQIARASGLPSSLICDLVAGRRPPSEANLTALAGVESLATSIEELRRVAAHDRGGLKLGPDPQTIAAHLRTAEASLRRALLAKAKDAAAIRDALAAIEEAIRGLEGE